MNDQHLGIPKDAKELRMRAQGLREKANELEQQAYELTMKRTRTFMREMQDKLLNRTQCLEYLSINTLESLKNWERKYSPAGYLRFKDNKILRSEILRFIDDKQSGALQQKINQLTNQ